MTRVLLTFVAAVAMSQSPASAAPVDVKAALDACAANFKSLGDCSVHSVEAELAQDGSSSIHREVIGHRSGASRVWILQAYGPGGKGAANGEGLSQNRLLESTHVISGKQHLDYDHFLAADYADSSSVSQYDTSQSKPGYEREEGARDPLATLNGFLLGDWWPLWDLVRTSPTLAGSLDESSGVVTVTAHLDTGEYTLLLDSRKNYALCGTTIRRVATDQFPTYGDQPKTTWELYRRNLKDFDQKYTQTVDHVTLTKFKNTWLITQADVNTSIRFSDGSHHDWHARYTIDVADFNAPADVFTLPMIPEHTKAFRLVGPHQLDPAPYQWIDGALHSRELDPGEGRADQMLVAQAKLRSDRDEWLGPGILAGIGVALAVTAVVVRYRRAQ